MENQTPKQPDSMNRLAKAVESYIKQDRWSRRWSNLLKFTIAVYFIVLVGMLTKQFSSNLEEVTTGKHIAVVKLQGEIKAGGQTSADVLIPLLQEAFQDEEAKAVVIQANSPGGSPVQSALINDEITRLKIKYKKPVYAVVEDMCASGCYYVVVAADKIYANKGSIIGSIGVRMDTFGFTGLMDKLGIENRSMHASKHKTFIDPFSPEDKVGRAFFQKNILERTRQQFIDTVKKGRGDRLKINSNTFSGLVWLGDAAVDNGMIDGLGSMGSVMRDVVKVKSMKVYEPEKSVIESLVNGIGTEAAIQFSNAFNGLK